MRPEPGALLVEIADYVSSYRVTSELAYETAHYCLMDTLACGFLALKESACTRLLGPVVPGATMNGGSRVPGTSYDLDPVQAAFNLGCMVRWLDLNDSWLAAESVHPSDTLGGILSVADYLSRCGRTIIVQDVLVAMIKAHEIQGVLALNNSGSRAGLDHGVLVRVATAAVTASMLGGAREQVINAMSNALIDVAGLRAYPRAPNTDLRMRWAAGDATSRGVWLAFLALKGEIGCPSPLTAKTLGFSNVLFDGKSCDVPQVFGSYVMENSVFKLSFTAELRGQTAVEAALQIFSQVGVRLEEIERVVIETQSSGLRSIDKTGPLANPAERDHCIQYMVAIALIFGRLIASDFEDAVAGDPRVDALRGKMRVTENLRFTEEYGAPDKHYIGNAVQVFFRDGSSTERVAVDCPIGHRKRRADGTPVLVKKFDSSVAAHFRPKQAETIRRMFIDRPSLGAMAVNDFMAQLVSVT